MHIGVFDSGIGGAAVAAQLQAAFPDARISQVNDAAHVPYGSRQPDEIIELTAQAIQPLLSSNCDVVVIACNTATAVAIDYLRMTYPRQRFIGLEPMVKPAPALSKTGTIAILATPATLRSERYAQAKSLYASNVKIIEPDCSDWASLIENNEINQRHIKKIAEFCLTNSADVVVLGCTHYHWIKDELAVALNGRAQLLEPTDAIVRRIKKLLRLQ